MRLRGDQIDRHLGETLAPIYMVSGDEPLQVQEVRDAIRRAAAGRGFDERVLLNVESGFDWNVLARYGASLSLFGDRRVIDLRMSSARPGDAGARALREYAASPSPDNLLLVSAPKLDRSVTSGKWYQDLDKAGVTVQLWPVDAERLPAWIARRAAARGLRLGAEACALLAEHVEGNLLACAQEIEKLGMLHGEGEVGTAEVLASVGDSARYNVFELVDTALGGDLARTARMLEGLREEGTAPPLVSWALVRGVRELAAMSAELARGADVEQVMASHRVWDKRRGPVGAALRRHRPRVWLELLERAAMLDRVVKGAVPGDAWDELAGLALAVGGLMFPARTSYNSKRSA